MADLSMKVIGLNELYRKMDQFPAKVQQNGARGAAFRGAQVVRGHARAGAPVGKESDGDKHPGLLRKNIVIARSRSPRGVYTYAVTIRKITMTYGDTGYNRRKQRVGKKYRALGPAWYGRFVLLGRRKYRMPVTDFLTPALANHTDEVLRAIKLGLIEAIEKASR